MHDLRHRRCCVCFLGREPKSGSCCELGANAVDREPSCREIIDFRLARCLRSAAFFRCRNNTGSCWNVKRKDQSSDALRFEDFFLFRMPARRACCCPTSRPLAFIYGLWWLHLGYHLTGDIERRRLLVGVMSASTATSREVPCHACVPQCAAQFPPSDTFFQCLFTLWLFAAARTTASLRTLDIANSSLDAPWRSQQLVAYGRRPFHSCSTWRRGDIC